MMDALGDQWNAATDKMAGPQAEGPIAHHDKRNLAADNPLFRLVCFECVGLKLKGDPAFFVDGNKSHEKQFLVVNSQWKRRADESRGGISIRDCEHKTKRAIEALQTRAKALKKAGDHDRAFEREKLYMILQDAQAAKMVDWVVQLGPEELGIFINYGHPVCDWSVPFKDPYNAGLLEGFALGAEQNVGCYPLKASGWFRANGNDKDVSYTALGPIASKEVHWHCPCCFGRYKPGDDLSKRLLTLGAHTKGEEVFSAYIGELTNEQSYELDFLRACAFSHELNGKVLNRQNMMEALEELAQRAEFRLGRHPQARIVHSASPQHNDRFTGHRIFSRSSVLSLTAIGVEVRCLLMDQRDVPTLGKHAVDAILGFVASMADFAVCAKRNEPAMQAAEARLVAKRGKVEELRQRAAAGSVEVKEC